MKKEEKSEQYHVILISYKIYSSGLEFFFEEFYMKKIKEKWWNLSVNKKMYLYDDIQFLKHGIIETNFNKIVKDKEINKESFPIEHLNTIYVLYNKKLFDYLISLKDKVFNILSKKNNYKLLLKKLNKKEKKVIQNNDTIIIKESDCVFKEGKYKFYKTSHKCRKIMREDYEYCPTCGVKIEWG